MVSHCNGRSDAGVSLKIYNFYFKTLGTLVITAANKFSLSKVSREPGDAHGWAVGESERLIGVCTINLVPKFESVLV